MILRDETILDAPPYWVRQWLQTRLRDDGLHAESAASFEQEHTLLVRAGVPGLSKTVAMVTLPAYQLAISATSASLISSPVSGSMTAPG